MRVTIQLIWRLDLKIQIYNDRYLEETVEFKILLSLPVEGCLPLNKFFPFKPVI